MTGLTDFQRMQLEAHHAANQAVELGLTAQDIRNMPWDEYNRLFGTPGRQTPAQAAIAGFQAQQDAQRPTQATQPQDAPQSLPQPPAPETQGVDIASMTLDEYALFREQAGIGVSQKEGRGIFDGVGSQSDAYTRAVRAQAGRTAMSNANVQEPPRLTGRTILKQNDRLDHRSAGQRFSTPGNLNQF